MSPVDGWGLFKALFEKGDNITVIDEDDVLRSGRLFAATKSQCSLQRLDGRIEVLDWEDIRFLSHDGFPVFRLKAADGRRSIEKIVAKIECPTCLEPVEIGHICPKRVEGRQDGHGRSRRLHSWFIGEQGLSIIFSDPFQADSQSALIYSGTSALGAWTDECLELTAKDGATALLWDFQNIHFVEGAGIRPIR